MKNDEASAVENAGKKVRHWEHRGAWEHNPLEGCHAWSCCVSTVRDSKGCTSTVITDQTKWNMTRS